MRIRNGSSAPYFFIVAAVIIFTALFGFAEDGTQPNRSVTPPTLSISPTASLRLSPQPDEYVLSGSASAEFVPVVRVVDGDTVTVLLNGKRETIRLIGVNTPETVDPRRPVECFGKEASEKVRLLLTGQRVHMETDPTQANRDRYNRLLRYLYMEDGRMVNKVLIEEGFAYEYTYDLPYRYQQEFKTAERMAQLEQRGLWRPDTCLGSR